MAKISLKHVYKVYPNGVKAVSDFTMDIADKEFIVFVGPSGCGKSTTLRMIAGLEDITAGELFIDDTLVNDMEPKDRDIAMVFQNYALYPHMTVYENMAFGLQLRNVPQEEIHKKVLWAAQILHLTEYLDRKPKAMSGGQRQRVALGRAILRNPKVFLLDEPLSNLDAKLRTDMRSEIANLHQQIGTTFIYVTHDQVEAMTLGTRVVVMKLGRIQQIDTPHNLYNYPANKFVAGFIGTPQMNFFPVKLKKIGDSVNVVFDDIKCELSVPFSTLIKVQPIYMNGKAPVTMGIRCEDLSVDPEVLAASKTKIKFKIIHFEDLGAETLIYGDTNLEGTGFSDSPTRIIIKSYKGRMGHTFGDVLEAAINMNKAHFFDSKNEKTIVPQIPEENVFDCTIKNGKMTILGDEVTLPKAISCENGDYTIYIPTKALIQGCNGLSSTVVKSEKISDVYVDYLSKEGRTYFITSKEALKNGEKINLGINFEFVSIYKGDEEVVNPFNQADAFVGSFSNSENAQKSERNLEKFYQKNLKSTCDKMDDDELKELSSIAYQPIMRKQLLSEYKKAVKEAKEDQSYRIGTEDVGKEGKKRIKAETDAKLKSLKDKYEADVIVLDKDEEKQKSLTSAESLALNKKTAEIQNKFIALKEEEKKNCEAICQNAREGLKNLKPFEEKRKEGMAQADKEIKAIRDNWKVESEAIEKDFGKRLDETQTKFEAASGNEKDQLHTQLLSMKQEKKNKLLTLRESCFNKEDEVLFSKEPFFAYVDGFASPTTYDDNKKIVKSLGKKVFSSQFRYEVPHDAYTIVPEGKGIPATVLDYLDFGLAIYAHCSCHGRSIYVKVDSKKLPKGNICLSFDVSKAHIFENKFDIALN